MPKQCVSTRRRCRTPTELLPDTQNEAFVPASRFLDELDRLIDLIAESPEDFRFSRVTSGERSFVASRSMSSFEQMT